MTCPFGHKLRYINTATGRILYCNNEICQVAYFTRHRKKIYFPLSKLERYKKELNQRKAYHDKYN